MPSEPLRESPWAHPARLPLGDSWAGQCTVPGHENDSLTGDELRHCNVGYAAQYCPRLPAQRRCDAVRFCVVPPPAEGDAGMLYLRYICEVDYRPGENGTLVFDAARSQWKTQHDDARIQQMADCYLRTWRSRRTP